jgi:hypothetical protein
MKRILKYKVKKSSDFVFDYLANPAKYVTVHPVIHRIESLGALQYLVFETLRWGLLRYTFTYPATIESEATRQTVVMKATILNCVKIEMVFKIKDNNDYSDIEETLCIDTLLPIKSMLGKIIKTQHAQVFKNIENSAMSSNKALLQAHSRLVQSGICTKATVLDINDSGKMVNFSPVVCFTLRLDEDCNKKIITPEAIVSLLRMPEIQAQINIAYLPDMPQFVAIV